MDAEQKMITQHYSSSPSIAKLAEALALAQLEMTGALKDSKNPFFNSTYADLASVLDTVKSCNKHGIAIIQMPFGGDGRSVGLTTLMAHSSGEWLSAAFTMTPAIKPTKADPNGQRPADLQDFGSCLTYMRRYAASSFAGVAQVDDDGNAASTKTEQPIKYITEQQVADIRATIKAVGVDESKLLAHFKAPSVDKILSVAHKAVVNALEAKRLQAAAKQKEAPKEEIKNIDTGWGGLSPDEQDVPQ